MGTCRHPALALFLALSVPARALAEPAVVKVFEAEARSAPDRSAPVVHVFAESARISVSEEATQGWRKVRLPDGGVGFVEERALAFPERPAGGGVPAPAPAAPATSAPPAPSTPAPRIYVQDLGHFAELVKDDPKVAPLARSLQARRTGAYLVGGVGLAISTGLSVAAVSHFGDAEGNRGRDLLVGGIVVATASVLAAWLILPSRADFLEAVNEWNARHPDRQFEVTPFAPPRLGALPPGSAREAPPGLTPVAGVALAW